ncbi:serine/threonine-protein kinase 3 [Ceratitis capitata]|uniref:serine/threonine-protein kinase 3 n=1 Tax=Ceratitis capitata TaxID=7213 RepID=UPI000329F3AE|nr:serine/threonine-protein kinase 3 [Ceratitis capitata]
MHTTMSSGVSSASETPPVADVDTSFKFANKTLQDYEVISVIGNGTFGTCFKVRDKQTGELYAWKGIDYDEFGESKKASLISEIRVLRQLQHPNIVQYYHHLVNHEAKSIYIVMECCEGGDLALLIKRARNEHQRFEERYIWRVLFQVCKALQVCHNNIKKGTILHRDIKPANIFLDTHGNAKLGDFGLARILRKNQDFTATFVGTPYYMSPEIVKGSQYDRKSDVWAVGCLTYEMCALRTPFQAAKFEELTLNISNGKFNHIPAVYSDDLQKTIALMLSVDSEERPSIEVIVRHPTVVRNIIELGNDFPKLVEAELDFFDDDEKSTSSRLECSPVVRLDFTSTMYTEYNSFNEEYGQRRWSDCFTPDLRTELFYTEGPHKQQKTMLKGSDPGLYESIKYDDSMYAKRELPMRPPLPPPKPSSLKRSTSDTSLCEPKSPHLISDDVFNEALQERLKAIRALESLLQHKEKSLNERAYELNIREKRLQDLEDAFYEREMLLTVKEKTFAAESLKAAQEKAQIAVESRVVVSRSPSPPPIPPRRSSANKEDDTYCCIEDTQLESPTIAKLTLPFAKRRVTFKSPQKLTTYEIENIPNAAVSAQRIEVSSVKAKQQHKQLQSSTTSQDRRASMSSGKLSNTTTLTTTKPIKSTETTDQRQRRSIFSSIFSRNSKGATSKSGGVSSQTKNKQTNNKSTQMKDTNIQPSSPPSSPTTAKRLTSSVVPAKTVVVVETDKPDPSSVWTKEYKRAAFGLLAVMNAGGTKSKMDAISTSIPNSEALNGRSKLRQSARERRSSTLCRQNKMRRSLTLPSTQSAANIDEDASTSLAISVGRSNHNRGKMLI